MRHLTSSPSSSPHYITPSSTSPYPFLSSSPTPCLPHVTSNVELNPAMERLCILCRHYRTIFPKKKKSPLKTRNVDLATMNVASNVGLDPAMERPCILCRQYWTILPKPRKAPSKMWNVGSDSKNVILYVRRNHVVPYQLSLRSFAEAYCPQRGKTRGPSRTVSPVISSLVEHRRQVKPPRGASHFFGRDRVRRTAQVGTAVYLCPCNGSDILHNARKRTLHLTPMDSQDWQRNTLAASLSQTSWIQHHQVTVIIL